MDDWSDDADQRRQLITIIALNRALVIGDC
jgi:hypothetical protein